MKPLAVLLGVFVVSLFEQAGFNQPKIIVDLYDCEVFVALKLEA